MLEGNAIVGQSGGPTSVINASLAGVMSGAAKWAGIRILYGMRFGVEGLMEENLIDLSGLPDGTADRLSDTPSSALGSSRHKLTEDDLPRIRKVLEKYDIRYFFLIGGNDTMDSIHRIEDYCRKTGYEMRGIGIPKTVDNDLYGTDHTPGFPSAARFNILSVRQAGRLAKDMRRVDGFTVFQTIGRDAGWLAAATALARRKPGDPPHLIYCPERPFHKDEFLEDADRCLGKYGFLSVVVSEGLKYPDGRPVSAATGSDRFGNTEYGAMSGASVAVAVHGILAGHTGLRGEFQVPESLPMCAGDRRDPGDVRRARGCGEEAVRLAAEGETGRMVTLERRGSDPVTFGYGTVPLVDVAVRAKAMPSDWLNERGNDVTREFLRYMAPFSEDWEPYLDLEDFV